MEGILRTPPNNNEAEISVLGSMMLDKNALMKAVNIVMMTDFYKDSHQSIFQAMQALIQRNEPVDQITVIDQLKKSGKIEMVGGAYYITGLVSSTPSAANVEYYAKIVKNNAVKRRIITKSTDLACMAYDTETSAEDLIAAGNDAFINIGMEYRGMGDNFKPMSEIMTETMAYVSEVYNSKEFVGIKSGFLDLDRLIGGFEPGVFYIIGARPSMGKTALSLAVAHNVAKQGNGVGILSLEMNGRQLGLRFLSADARVRSDSFKRADITQDEFHKLSQAAGRLSQLPIYIDGSFERNADKLMYRVRSLINQYDIKLLIFDYLQLMNKGGRQESRNLEIASISSALKICGEKEDIPIIALSQLSRSIENRKPEDQLPMLSDLRDSGSLEQDADTVMFVYRPERQGLTIWGEGQSTKNLAIISVPKQKNGETGEVFLNFRSEYILFDNYCDRDTDGDLF